MIKLFHPFVFAAALSGLSCLLAGAAEVPNLDDLQGKWVVQKTNAEGRRYSYNLEFKQATFTFSLLDGEGQLRLYAKGSAKVEKNGPFKTLAFFDMQGGRTADDLAPVEDTRTAVYTLFGDKLHLVTNFDKVRNNETPTLDAYSRAEPAPAKAAAGGAGGLDAVVGLWKLAVTLGDNELEYTLRVDKADGQLSATLISPRSGEHKCKSVTFKDNQLLVELVREYDGNEVTLVYDAKLKDGKLEGTVKNKGGDTEVSGTIKATK